MTVEEHDGYNIVFNDDGTFSVVPSEKIETKLKNKKNMGAEIETTIPPVEKK